MKERKHGKRVLEYAPAPDGRNRGASTRSPQARGRSERLSRTFQNQLVNELAGTIGLPVTHVLGFHSLTIPRLALANRIFHFLASRMRTS